MLPDKAYEALAKREGPLYLDGLPALSPEVAKVFAKQKRHLFLEGLREHFSELTEEARQVIAGNYSYSHAK